MLIIILTILIASHIIAKYNSSWKR